jgi:hypothetical protein
MRAEALRFASCADTHAPGPPRWLAIAAVWVFLAAIDFASSHERREANQ